METNFYEKYGGSADYDSMGQRIKELVEEANRTCKQLGDNKYILNNYMFSVIRAIADIDFLAAYEDGCHNIFNEVRETLNSLKDGTDIDNDNMLAKEIKEFIEHNPNIPNSLKSQAFLTMRFDCVKSIIQEYTCEYDSIYKNSLEKNSVKEKREELLKHIPEADVRSLDDKIYSGLINISAEKMIAQGIIVFYSTNFLSEDEETGVTLLSILDTLK